MTRFLVDTLLYLMDYSGAYKGKYDEQLLRDLETIYERDFQKVKEVLSHAPPALWAYYESVGIKGTREQLLLEDAKRGVKRAIATAIREEASRASSASKRGSRRSRQAREGVGGPPASSGSADGDAESRDVGSSEEGSGNVGRD